MGALDGIEGPERKGMATTMDQGAGVKEDDEKRSDAVRASGWTERGDMMGEKTGDEVHLDPVLAVAEALGMANTKGQRQRSLAAGYGDEEKMEGEQFRPVQGNAPAIDTIPYLRV